MQKYSGIAVPDSVGEVYSQCPTSETKERSIFSPLRSCDIFVP